MQGQDTPARMHVHAAKDCQWNMQEFGDMFSALRAVAAYYFRADKQGICNTLEKCVC